MLHLAFGYIFLLISGRISMCKRIGTIGFDETLGKAGQAAPLSSLGGVVAQYDISLTSVNAALDVQRKHTLLVLLTGLRNPIKAI